MVTFAEISPLGVTVMEDEFFIVKSWTMYVIIVPCEIGLLVPVMVRVKFPALLPLHVIEAMPEPLTEAGTIDPQVSSEGIVSLSTTLPSNPLRPLIVALAVIDAPMLVMIGVVADIAKSWNRIVVVVVCTRESLEPLMVRV